MSRLAAILFFVGVAVLAVGAMHVFKTNAEPVQQRDEFAQDRQPPPVDSIPFDGARAMKYLEQVCAIGPRISGTGGFKKEVQLVQKHFEAAGGRVTLQQFSARQHSQSKPVEMANMVVSWYPDRPRRIILCSHYDTRPIADQEPDRRKWHEPFISANDGASGVAFLMELANHMKGFQTGVGVDFVLFDGEEYIFEPEGDKYFFGSEYFAQEYRRSRNENRYIGAVLLDMVGGKNATFPIEQNSWLKAEALAREIWGLGQDLKVPAFQNQFSRTAVLDDHMALNEAGIPTVDLIDFEYPHWHRLSDVPANCSADSLMQVARVLTAWMHRQK
jgi:glutaminyl-peptide cyclotransferase